MEIKLSNLKGYEDCNGYTIDENGIIRSYIKKGINRKFDFYNYDNEPKIISVSKKGNGYLHCAISCGNQKNKYPTIHRLLALAFIPNPHDLEQVNHINGEKDDNRLENLEWVSRKRNAEHAYEIGKNSPDHLKKSVNQYTLDGEYVRKHNSVSEAILSLGFKNSSKSAITRCCQGKQKTCGGYKWEFA